MFGRNLYDTDVTNSILEIKLTLYCSIFEEIKSSFLNVADFFKYSCSDTSHFDVGLVLYWGTRWRRWFWHRATSRKVEGSIPDGVIGIFRNPSGRTVALGWPQPLTDMSTRNISWG